MKHDFSQDDILQVVEMFGKLKLDMQTVFNADFHFHGSDGLCLLCVVIVVHDGEVDFLCDGGFHVPIDGSPDEVSDSPCDSIESLVLFLETGELEVEFLAFSQETGRLQFLRERMKLS